MRQLSRRQLLAGAGAVGAGLIGGGASTVASASSWEAVASPTGKTLYEVVDSDNGPYAVGGSGILAHRASGGWEIALSDGPTGNNKTLHGAAVTDGGNRVWMCGSSGRLGSYDVGTGTLRDYSKPNGVGNTFTDVEVVGTSNDERVYCTMGSGKLVVGVRQSDGSFSWTTSDTGGGYTLTAADFHTRTDGRVVSTGATVYETHDGGGTWTAVGVESATNPFYDVVSQPDNVYVAAANGRIWREDCGCSIWTPHKPTAKTLNATVLGTGGSFLGAGASGRVVERQDGEWTAYDTSTGNVLLGCHSGTVDVAVGKSGTILERA